MILCRCAGPVAGTPRALQLALRFPRKGAGSSGENNFVRDGDELTNAATLYSVGREGAEFFARAPTNERRRCRWGREDDAGPR